MPQGLLTVEASSEGEVVERENRFLVSFRRNGVVDYAHLHDPGRLKELIYPGNRLLLKKAFNTSRKTSWDVIAAMSPGGWVFVHSGYHSAIAQAIVEKGLLPWKVVSCEREVRLGKSRIDFLLRTESGSIWLEVKGCTLARDGVALFPDAPTERGRRHIEELKYATERGERSAVLFLVFRRDAQCFSPNWETDPEFSKTLKKAKEEGVEVLAYLLSYDGHLVSFLKALPILL